jgi:acyl carrier protein
MTVDTEVWNELTAVLREVFDDPEISIRPDTTADDIDGWDSLTHVQLIVAVEARFKVRFKHAEVARFSNVGDMVESIKRHRDGGGA